MQNNAKPFLKWAGGKTQLLAQFEEYWPQELIEEKIDTYIEPFIGGGAVFFYLQSRFKFNKVVLNDINKEVILTYKIIRDSVDELILILENLHNQYNSMENLETKESLYYKVREQFNREKKVINYDLKSSEWVSHAANMIFLNKTCFNGLFRLNRSGDFNVPFGKRKTAPICDEENLRLVNRALENVILISGDFQQVEEYIESKTFVYIDPPYRPLPKTASFNDYSKEPFNDETQVRLGQWAKKICCKNDVKIMISNSDPKNTDAEDNFFEEVYNGFSVNRVKALRNINSKGTGRGAISELLITNYGENNLVINEVAIDSNKINGGNAMKYEKSQETFKYLMSTLKDSIKGWDYFVNWTKVFKNVNEAELSLNILNYLIGKTKEEIEIGLKEILAKYPEVIKVIPILIATRDMEFKLVKISEDDLALDLEIYDFTDKNTLNEDEIGKIIDFIDNTGLLKLFTDKKIKNLVDYVMGIEVGLDSNGRKNRSGTSMESLVEKYIKVICNEHGFEYMTQATSGKIKTTWGYEVKVDKADRRFDFAIKANEKLYVIETNYYGGGGSKLKSTAGEYKTLQQMITDSGFELIWITDGKGWLTAAKSLEDTFNNNNFILNLQMVQDGMLEKIINF